MTDPLLEQDGASTPLTHEERQDLIPSYITLRRELNEAEQTNILETEEWGHPLFIRKSHGVRSLIYDYQNSWGNLQEIGECFGPRCSPVSGIIKDYKSKT